MSAKGSPPVEERDAGPFRPVDGASLAALRIGFGVSLFYGVWRYFLYGKIQEYFLEPSFHFTYLGFGWVGPWPGAGMYVHFAALGVLSCLLVFGLWYRVSATLFFLGFSYVFLLEKARYLNHYYLVILLAFLLIFVPAHRALSIDARRRGWVGHVPSWSLFLIRSQIGLVYFFAGVAKLNGDWLRAQPLAMWLPERAGLPVLGPLFATEWAPWLFSYGGLLLDLLAWPLLSWRRTRVPAFLLLLSFHLMNAVLFNIGIFPWLMIGATTIFFSPGWPRRFLGLRRAGAPPRFDASASRRRLVVAAVAGYLAIQFLVPLRHFLYPGDVNWTEEGHRFSWHMKLRDKEAESRFFVTDLDSGSEWPVDPRGELETWQYRKMSGRPDMLQEYALHLAQDLRARGLVENPKVRVQSRCSLNDRPYQDLIDSSVDLAREPRSLARSPWIVPLRPR